METNDHLYALQSLHHDHRSPSPMSTAFPFALTPEVKALVAGAFDGGNILLVAAVAKDRKPLLSFPGTPPGFSDNQLSFLARNAEAAPLEALMGNPNLPLQVRSKSVP